MRILRMIACSFLLLAVSSGQVLGFSTNNTTITRGFDKSSAVTGELITATVTFTNNESASLRGFYYAEEVPQALVVNTVSVKINGSVISNYVFESGSVGDVYPGNVVYRWILETPTAFSENHPLSSGTTAEIVYTLSSPQAGIFNLDEFNWVGYYQGGSKAAFGHSKNGDKKSLNILPTISGNAGVASATLSYTDGTPKTATADGGGNYSFTVSYSWSGTVTPTKTGYTFLPVNRTYTNVLSNQTSQNYTAVLQIFSIIYVSNGGDGSCNGHSPCWSNIQNGIAHASAPTIIEITEGPYVENIILDFDQEITLQGGWDTNFTSSESYTTINGSITITNGTMIFEYIILE